MTFPQTSADLMEAFCALSALVDDGWEEAGMGVTGPWAAEEPVGEDRLRLAVAGSTRRLSSRAHGFALAYQRTSEEAASVVLVEGTLEGVRACLSQAVSEA
jgi:hypothetical protein